MTKPDLNLDVASPPEVARVLRAAAEQFELAACELGAAWQDKRAGRAWARFARELERAAERCEKALKQEGW